MDGTMAADSSRHHRARLTEWPKPLQQHSCYKEVLAACPAMEGGHKGPAAKQQISRSTGNLSAQTYHLLQK
ncbi:hypothetical protein GGR62_001244 [Xanthomonas campestris]|nr:hypothetical protein [Xanthomonas sp. 3075]